MQGVKDYRIGNRLTYCGQPCYVLGLRKDIIELGYFIDSVGFERRYTNADIQPIPLTPELLEKLGWGNRTWVEIGNCTYVGVEFAVKDKAPMYAYVQLEKNNEGVTERHEMPHIKYLHQLQNLFFSLCGIEIPITTLTHN